MICTKVSTFKQIHVTCKYLTGLTCNFKHCVVHTFYETDGFQTDNATNKIKDTIWEQITNGYNAQQTTGIKSTNQLKNVYDNLKRLTRKGKSDKKVSYYLNTSIF